MSIITDYIIAKFSLEVSISTIPGLKISVSKIKEVSAIPTLDDVDWDMFRASSSDVSVENSVLLK